MSEPDRLDDELVRLTGGDLEAARLVRSNLAALRDQLADAPGQEELRRSVDAVLTGRSTMRELAADPAFEALTRDGMHQAQQAWSALTREQRDAAMRAGDDR